ncbi:hypothetical protein [Microbispora sp. H11081]|uniref:hypothetical protein n=1 Tax=Microbispora sp. H11081 TaxID=2729107 RepID=UPI001475E2A8|nr:hypothetical protein [Microbispora sp. H11081]
MTVKAWKGRSAVVTLLTAVLALALPTGPAGAQTGKTYRGTASVVVDVYDYCGGQFGGNRRFVGTSRYRAAAQLITGTRQSAGRQVERNPFHWEFYVGKIGAVGSFQLGSSTIVTASGRDIAGNPRDPRLLLGYWVTGRSGASWSGKLVDDHRAEGASFNHFWAQTPLVPCRDLGSIVNLHSLKEGATISGRVSSGGAAFTIRGATYDGLYRFRIDFSG